MSSQDRQESVKPSLSTPGNCGRTAHANPGTARFSAVIFDLDGTLLDTLSDLARSANQALRELGFPVHPTEAYRYFVGDGMRQLIVRCLPDNYRDNPDLIKRGIELMAQYYAQNWHDQTRPYPGITEVIAKLQAAGIIQAVLSNKPDQFTRQVTDHFFPEQPFTLIRGHKPEFPPKPDPASGLAMARQLGIDPCRILYLGDTSTDMKTAVAAGFWPVGASWGFRTRQELTDHGARNLLEQPGELTALLELNSKAQPQAVK